MKSFKPRKLKYYRKCNCSFTPRPDFIHEALAGLLLFLLPACIPRPQAQEAQRVHPVNFHHAPAVLHQVVAGGVNVFRPGETRRPSERHPYADESRLVSPSRLKHAILHDILKRF